MDELDPGGADLPLSKAAQRPACTQLLLLRFGKMEQA
jgi:hypothetical protein